MVQVPLYASSDPARGGRILERLEESQKNGGGSFQMAKPVVQ